MNVERKSCFKCGYAAETDRGECPQCGRALQTARKIRGSGLILTIAGGFITVLMGVIAFFCGRNVAESERWQPGDLSAGEQQQLVVIFGIFTAVFALGLAFTTVGVWQLIFGRRNKFLVWATIGLSVAVFFAVRTGTGFIDAREENRAPQALAYENARRGFEQPRGSTAEAETTEETDETILNDDAIDLPKPVYPQAARAVSASGKVRVQVAVSAAGKVLSAKAVSGNPFLRAAAEQAARAARFKPFAVEGILIFNFTAQ